MRFVHVEYLYMSILPILFIVFSLIRIKKTKNHLREKGTVKNLLKFIDTDIFKNKIIGYTLISLSLFFMLISLARPQLGKKKITIKRPVKDIYVAIDLSASMRAEDISPSRFDRAKLLALNIVNSLKGERAGLVVFSSNAFIQYPPTTDYDIILNTLQSITSDATVNIKTSLTSVISLLTNTVPKGRRRSTMVVILTDGEDNAGEYKKRLRKIKNPGFNTWVIGIGTISGAPVPDKFVDDRRIYLKDKSGDIVITRLRKDIISSFISFTGGRYIISSNILKDTNLIIKSLKKMSSDEKIKSFNVKKEIYQIPLILSIILLIIYICYTPKKVESKI